MDSYCRGKWLIFYIVGYDVLILRIYRENEMLFQTGQMFMYRYERSHSNGNVIVLMSILSVVVQHTNFWKWVRVLRYMSGYSAISYNRPHEPCMDILIMQQHDTFQLYLWPIQFIIEYIQCIWYNSNYMLSEYIYIVSNGSNTRRLNTNNYMSISGCT